ncbi:PRKC apoptosis WT1 regulator protein [Bagarius yarrelli]|uniref:PRKC apoptosis WT1 regulator protein n=1 Tax=Bagarius yarrelli TaxID=175774 RepID=A0A556VW50_BAGYA|nr:PRKC apoptosis WT1 regulator protein [Bagarius yarrelli]
MSGFCLVGSAFVDVWLVSHSLSADAKMASGGFKSNAATDFLEEWKAKREKMRAKMLGDIAAITSANAITMSAGSMKTLETRSVPDLNNSNGNPERNSLLPNAVARSASSSAVTRKAEEEPHIYAAPAQTSTTAPRGSDAKKPTDTLAEPGGALDSDRESPKGKEKKSSGPSARKGKGQIEKRKLREKRRSTGVVNIPSNESLDELDDDDGGGKERKNEEVLTQHNTVQNESMTSGHPLVCIFEEDIGSSRHCQAHARHSNAGLEKRIEELEKELALERQENAQLLNSHQDKDELIVKLKEEIDLLNRDLDEIEDENEQLKQENKTLLKVVGQLTR